MLPDYLVEDHAQDVKYLRQRSKPQAAMGR